MGKIYKGDVGTELRVDTRIDLSSQTKVRLKVMKPGSDTEVEWTPTVVAADDGVESVLKYIADTDDFDVVGWYNLIAYVEFGGGTSKFHGEPARFEVHELYLP